MKLAESVISYIQIRSTEGFDKNGKKFPKYSTDYAKFKGVGKSQVDLVLSGEMLDSLSLTKDGAGFIEIGYKDSSDYAGRAEGNILGTYGQPDPIPGKKRDFLGIDEADLEIMADVINTEVDIEQIAKDAAREIFGDILFDDGE